MGRIVRNSVADGRSETARTPRQPGDTHPERKPRLVNFSEDDFVAIVRKLHRKYPAQWVGVAVLEEDLEQRSITGEIIAHSQSQALALERVAEYQSQHSGTAVRFFTTELALSRTPGA